MAEDIINRSFLFFFVDARKGRSHLCSFRRGSMFPSQRKGLDLVSGEILAAEREEYGPIKIWDILLIYWPYSTEPSFQPQSSHNFLVTEVSLSARISLLWTAPTLNVLDLGLIASESSR